MISINSPLVTVDVPLLHYLMPIIDHSAPLARLDRNQLKDLECLKMSISLVGVFI